MARDFSQNANRSLRVAGGAMRRPLVSTGLGFELYKAAVARLRDWEFVLRVRLDRGETIEKMLRDPRLSEGFKRFAMDRAANPRHPVPTAG